MDTPIAYSGIHGSGSTMVPRTLKHLGFTNIHVVKEQEKPDGNFPTVHYPNPEEKSAMEKVVALARSVGASVALATDPDADRVGVAIPRPDGEYMLLNGNQALCMMMAFLMRDVRKEGKPYVVKTIVTSELIDAMAAKSGVTCYNTLTGFKYIAQIMGRLEGREKFIAAGEESYGYMVGDFVRDKDAVSACALFAVMAARAREAGETLYDMLMDTYRAYGFYKEGLFTLTLKGLEGQQQIKAMMDRFRSTPPPSIGGSRLAEIRDYQSGRKTLAESGETEKLDFPKSDVLQYYTEGGTKVSVRPSGTEPKIKFYIAVRGSLERSADFERVNAGLDAQIKSIYDEFAGSK
jgi:phosphoglucomutase